MAKQYIPKISGLLTEPNPVDAPSNSLSEAENVIIDQDGKVQARHGLNVEEYTQTISSTYQETQLTSSGQSQTTVTHNSYNQSYDLTKYIDGNKELIINGNITNYKNHYLDTNVNSASLSTLIANGKYLYPWVETGASTFPISYPLNPINPISLYQGRQLSDSVSNTEHYIQQFISGQPKDATFTVFIKPTTNAYINSTDGYLLRLILISNMLTETYADFKINGIQSPEMISPINEGQYWINSIASFEEMPTGGWYRLRLSSTYDFLAFTSISTVKIQIIKYSNSGTIRNSTYLGDGTPKFYVFGAQVNKGLDILPYVFGFTDAVSFPSQISYTYASEYAKQLPFMKLIEYKDSSDNYKTILLVKQTKNPYNFKDTLLGKSLQYNISSSIINKYYMINNESSEIEKYGGIPYNNITNAFINKNSLYLHTENGLAEANVDDVDRYTENRFFTFEWPGFPELTYTLEQSNSVANWLYAGYKCAVKMTFYRESGYSDKEDIIYESEPSNPIIIISTNLNSIPKIFIDFPAIHNNQELYNKYKNFTKLNGGRKFGIKLYRTVAVPLSENIPDEYFQCVPDYQFNNFFISKISTIKNNLTFTYNNSSYKYFALGDNINLVSDKLEIGDNISFIKNENLPSNIYYSSNSITGVQSRVNPSEYYMPIAFTTDRFDILLSDAMPIKLVIKDIQVDGNGINYYLFYTINSANRYDTATKTITTINSNNYFDFTNSFTSSITDFIPIIKSPVFLLELNDSALKVQPRLYTDRNVDSNGNINLYAPISNNSIQYKDFRVYYNITKSLTATLFVTKQPSVNTFLLKPMVNNTKNYYQMQIRNFANYTGYIPTISNGVANSIQKYFIDCPIFPNQYQQIQTNTISSNYDVNGNIISEITSIDAGLPLSLPFTGTLNGVSVTAYNNVTVTAASPAVITLNASHGALANGNVIGFYTSFPGSLPSPILGTKYYFVRNYNSINKSFNISETSSGALINTTTTGSNVYILPASAFSNIAFQASIFSSSRLLLKLTSNKDIVNEILIETYPSFNRNGYYDLLTKSGSLDNRSLEFNASLFESNGPRNLTSANTVKYSMYSPSNLADTADIPGVTFKSGNFQVPGNAKNQRKFDGRITPIFGNASSNLVYSSTNGGTLTVKNILEFPITSTSRVFDKNAFVSPGHILIEWGAGTYSRRSILSYSSIDSDTANANTYIFKQAIVVAGDTSLTQLTVNDIAYLYYIPGTNVNNFVLYPYDNAPYLEAYNYVYNSTTPWSSYFSTLFHKFKDGYNQSSTGTPILTYLSHNDRTSTPVAKYSQDGNIRFLGADSGFAKTYDELLNEYTWSIINKFNYQLQSKNIPARVRKGEADGELIIDYPDGKKIEIFNQCGDHEFYPALKETSTVLAERTNNDWYEKNLIKLSRRDIPEISTLSQYAYIGKNTKNIIGAASNVDDLYIFKEDGIWRGTDNGKDIPELETSQFSTTLICQASGSIQEINEEIIFLSQYGFMSIANGGIENISGAIQNDILKLIQTSPKDRIQSFVNESKQLYYCTLINEVDSTLDVKSGTYVFNTKTREWTFINQEILTGISDNKNRNLVAYRQIPILGTFKSPFFTGIPGGNAISYDYPLQKYTEPLELTPSLSGILNHYYISRERFTNNLSTNPLDQYDFINLTDTRPLKKGSNNTIYQLAPLSTETAGFNFQYPFGGKTILLRSDIDSPTYDESYPVIDSYVQFLLNKTIYLKKDNNYYQLKLNYVTYSEASPMTGAVNETRRVYAFVDSDIPAWFTALFEDSNLTNANIIVGVPAKITFNPESGNQPDTNKLFQEYMIHTETANKGALMSFKTDSQSSFTTDRRFVYDATATNRNVFRTYIPTNVARGRYLIRRVKHDLPLENLIITGQTIVMRDSGSTRVQKDKDSN